MKKLFGTDGIRGVANVELTVELAMQVGKTLAYILKEEKERPKILIGKDTRLSGYMLENALTAGICSMCADVLLVGPIPTPGIAFLTTSMRADAGIVISASHNPFQDNGIKFFSRDGFKLPDEWELKMEELIFSNTPLKSTASEIGKAFRIDDAKGRYIVFLKNSFPQDLCLDGLKIVLDCANGAAYKVAPAVLEELGVELIAIGIKPNGKNINLKCGSIHPEMMQRATIKNKAHLGMALDGDGDRVIFTDEKGNIIDGDHIMAICARDMLKKGQLKNNVLISTVMSNLGLDIAVQKAGGKVIKTPVGDRYVVEEMLKGGYNLGGEQSGHIVFLDHNTTGDGIITALQVLAVMQREGKTLSELASQLVKLPQVLLNAEVKRKENLLEISPIADKIKKAEDKLDGNGRVLIRYSGTEPLVRVMIEGQDQEEIHSMAIDIVQTIESILG